MAKGILNMFNYNNNKGFTLIELIIVIAILGILSSIAVPKLSDYRTRAAITAHNANIEILETAAHMFILDYENLGITNKEDNIIYWPSDDSWEKYIRNWPKIPKPLLGKEFQTLDRRVEFNKREDYQVEINPNGEIKVEPGKISN